MAHPVEMPKLGFDMAEGTLINWVKNEGDPVQKGEVIAEIETDKATVEVEAHHAGVMRKHMVPAGAVVPVGKLIAVIGEPDEAIDLARLGGAPAIAAPPQPISAPTGAAPAPAPSRAPQPAAAPPTNGGPTQPATEGVRASPLARKLAGDLGLDIRQISGTGPGGRITRRDVEAFRVVQPAPEAMPEPAPGDVTEAQTRLRRAIGRRMAEAKQQVPHFYVTAEVDMAAAMKLRSELNATLEDQGIKVSVNDLVVKAAALALREYANLNSTFQGENVLRHGQINVGVAVAVPGGLLTVVTRDTDHKPLAQLAKEARALIASAREGKFRPDDITGSTFTVSNLGMYDVEHFIAIINPPESAILAVGSILEVPVIQDGQVVPGSRLKVTVSADHRVTDGAEAAQFLQAVRRNLEQPLRLLL